jgi:predicted transcriptional regulator
MNKLEFSNGSLPKTSYLNIRLDEQSTKQLKELANKENRTLSNLVETIIKDYLNKRGDK